MTACRYDLALAREALGETEAAVAGYTRALELDPGFAPALLNRGVLAYRQDRLDQAVDDFERGLRGHASDPALRGRLHHNLALAHLARGDRPAALEAAEAAARLGHGPSVPLRDGLRNARPNPLPPPGPSRPARGDG